MSRRYLLLPVAMLMSVLVSGCALARWIPVTSFPAPVGETEPRGVEQPAETPADEAKPPFHETLKLVPLSSDLKCCVELSYPEGWQIMPTALGDSLEIVGDNVRIFLMTGRLQGAAPLTVDEYRGLPYEFPTTDVVITQQSVPGTVSAFETRYVSAGPDGKLHVSLSFVRFGSTYRESLAFSMPAEEFSPEWEALFYRIAATYQHSNLDAIPVPGRP